LTNQTFVDAGPTIKLPVLNVLLHKQKVINLKNKPSCSFED